MTDKDSRGADSQYAEPLATASENKPVPTETPKYRIWAMTCPFRRTGSPVVGNVGSSLRTVVIVELETWKRLCEDVPQLQTTMFEVGSYGD